MYWLDRKSDRERAGHRVGNTFLTTEPNLDLTPPGRRAGLGQTNTLPPNVLADLAQFPAGAPHPDLGALTVATATKVGQSLQAHGTEMLIGTAAGETLTGGSRFSTSSSQGRAAST